MCEILSVNISNKATVAAGNKALYKLTVVVAYCSIWIGLSYLVQVYMIHCISEHFKQRYWTCLFFYYIYTTCARGQHNAFPTANFFTNKCYCATKLCFIRRCLNPHMMTQKYDDSLCCIWQHLYNNRTTSADTDRWDIDLFVYGCKLTAW